MPSAISAEAVSKLYRLGTVTSRTAWEDLTRWWVMHVAGREDPRWTQPAINTYADEERPRYIWAVQDISFSAEPGEVIGIIGQNGAGKSTLLKILSRITVPTKGCVKLNGRLASLLEIGTGFHPELTGRENIYLNGSILGMDYKEITRRLDEIIEFAEIAEFVDTPVKRYSSGMHMRLAFSVAAHLETDILVVDEVLAVGDIAFQQKCLTKMGGAGEAGRTVLFVSHRMDHVTSLCRRAILLSHGQKLYDGPTAKAMARYYALFDREIRDTLRRREDRTGFGHVRIVDAWVSNGRRERTQTVVTGDDVYISIRIENQGVEPVGGLIVQAEIFSFGNLLVAALSTGGNEPLTITRSATVEFAIPRLMLNAGLFSLTCRVRHADGYDEDVIENAISIGIDFGDFHGIGQSSGGFLSLAHKAALPPHNGAA
jgi:lipopolysaccharide transport system ATP-binding protein